MNKVTVHDDALTIEPIGMDKVWSFTSRITVPLAHVRGATADDGIAGEPKGVRAPGLQVPGKTAGTYRHHGERIFWNVSDPAKNVVVQFVDEPFDRAVLTVEDPHLVERLVNDALPDAAAH